MYIEMIEYLKDKGSNSTTACGVSEELQIELIEDIPFIKYERIQRLTILSNDEKKKLWTMVKHSMKDV
jgi:hypothetical protein